MRSSPRLARARSPVVPAEVYLYNPCSRSIRMDRALSSTFEAFAPDTQYSCSPPTRLRRLLVCLSLSAPTCRRSISPQTISPQRISLARYSSEGSCSTESYSDMAGGCSNRASIVVSIAWRHRDVLPTGRYVAGACVLRPAVAGPRDALHMQSHTLGQSWHLLFRVFRSCRQRYLDFASR